MSPSTSEADDGAGSSRVAPVRAAKAASSHSQRPGPRSVALAAGGMRHGQPALGLVADLAVERDGLLGRTAARSSRRPAGAPAPSAATPAPP